jgi:hypothetical protein
MPSASADEKPLTADRSGEFRRNLQQAIRQAEKTHPLVLHQCNKFRPVFSLGGG